MSVFIIDGFCIKEALVSKVVILRNKEWLCELIAGLSLATTASS